VSTFPTYTLSVRRAKKSHSTRKRVKCDDPRQQQQQQRVNHSNGMLKITTRHGTEKLQLSKVSAAAIVFKNIVR